MEAFLLTLDVLAFVLLCWCVKRVSVSNNPDDMRWFAYAKNKVVRRKKQGVGRDA